MIADLLTPSQGKYVEFGSVLLETPDTGTLVTSDSDSARQGLSRIVELVGSQQTVLHYCTFYIIMEYHGRWYLYWGVKIEVRGQQD